MLIADQGYDAAWSKEALNVRDTCLPLWPEVLRQICPIFGKVPGWGGLTVAVMHWGITLATLIADCLSSEILSGTSDRLIGPYGLARFGQSGGTEGVL